MPLFQETRTLVMLINFLLAILALGIVTYHAIRYRETTSTIIKYYALQTRATLPLSPEQFSEAKMLLAQKTYPDATWRLDSDLSDSNHFVQNGLLVMALLLANAWLFFATDMPRLLEYLVGGVDGLLGIGLMVYGGIAFASGGADVGFPLLICAAISLINARYMCIY